MEDLLSCCAPGDTAQAERTEEEVEEDYVQSARRPKTQIAPLPFIPRTPQPETALGQPPLHRISKPQGAARLLLITQNIQIGSASCSLPVP